MDIEFITRVKHWAIDCHCNTNHFYDKHPYSYHLQLVYDSALNFIQLIPEELRTDVLAACWAHDTIEDTRQSYNDVKQATNERVADIVYACTTEKGRTRDERNSEKYYRGIRSTNGATFVKIADRIANTLHSKINGTQMFLKYQKELPHFLDRLYEKDYSVMFAHLANISDIELSPRYLYDKRATTL